MQGLITQVAQTQPTPADWCCVHNFQAPHRPKALGFPPGEGRELQRDMERLIPSLRSDPSQLFRREDYQEQRQALEARLSQASNRSPENAETASQRLRFQITSLRQGMFTTLLFKGKPIKVEPFEAVNQQGHTRVPPRRRELNEAMRIFFQHVHTPQEEVNKQIKQLNYQMAFDASEPRFEALRQKYQAFPKVLEHLRAVQQDMLENLEDFLAEPEAIVEGPGMEREPPHRSSVHYAVNVVRREAHGWHESHLLGVYRPHLSCWG